MALTKITKTGLGADSIDASKIADNAISDEHLDATAISGQVELAEAAAGTDVLLIFDTSTGTLKKIQASNVGVQAPTISSVSPTNVVSGDGTGNYTFIITGTGFTGASASLVNNSGSVVSFDTVTVNSSTQITGVIAKSNLPGSGEPYDVKVTAANGLVATLENQINIDQSPTFNTASGTLGTVLNALVGSTNLDIVAFDPESAGNVTFEVITGSLPADASGTTVNEDGVSKFRISGFSAVGSNTTSTFTVRAADVNSNVSTRQFSITVNAPVSESFTTSGTFSVPAGITAVDVLVVGGGGGAGATHSGGGGAGGLIFVPGFTVTPGGTVSVTVGCGGNGAVGSSGSSGQDSAFGTLTAKGGGNGGGGDTIPGAPGGSGGGSGYGPSNGGTATQPTQPGDSGTYGFGNPGGNSDAGAPRYGTGGGGGAGAAGAAGNNGAGGAPDQPYAGPGGIGKAYTIADGTTPVYYAGGGGGGSGNNDGAGSISQGGQGGGGNGVTSGSGFPGTANRGGGGGGSDERAPSVGGTGGKGIVIVRY
jgi:hypothetical protein